MRKGIILAGGTGSRLYPLTKSISKQLLPVFDKPMIFYPLTTLMLSGIREILIITNEEFLIIYKNLLGDGHQLGIKIEYKIQKKPEGIAQGLIIGEEFIGSHDICLILGDNIFYGHELVKKLQKSNLDTKNSTIYAYRVSDPERYGVVEFNNNDEVLSISEKPTKFISNYAVTGIYFYGNSVIDVAKSIKPSNRGELEITDINNIYLKKKELKVELMGRGYTWLDAGTFESLHDASLFIKTLQERQGLKIGCPEEISFRNGWITKNDLEKLAHAFKKNDYGKYLDIVLNE